MAVIAVDTLKSGVAIPDGGVVLVADSSAPPAVRDRLSNARIGGRPVASALALIRRCT